MAAQLPNRAPASAPAPAPAAVRIPDPDVPPRRVGFLLVQGHALMSAAAAIEPLRAANLLAGRVLYRLRFLSEEGGMVGSSAGSLFPVEPVASAGEAFDVVFVVVGGNPLAAALPRAVAWLRRLAARGVALGGISGGAVVLARAGLMRNRRFTVHWEHADALASLSESLLLERRLFVIDRDRLTCAGGVAPLDMMHSLIASEHGADFARRVSDWFIHTRVRTPEEPQTAGTGARYGARHPAVVAALELMDSHVADPLSVEQLAGLAGVTPRHLGRLFGAELGTTPKQAYLAMRAEKAAEVMRKAPLTTTEAATLCGFSDRAHLARTARRLGIALPAARG